MLLSVDLFILEPNNEVTSRVLILTDGGLDSNFAQGRDVCPCLPVLCCPAAG
jgi:hypothetical protein